MIQKLINIEKMFCLICIFKGFQNFIIIFGLSIVDILYAVNGYKITYKDVLGYVLKSQIQILTYFDIHLYKYRSTHIFTYIHIYI